MINRQGITYKVLKVFEKVMLFVCVLFVVTHMQDFQQWLANIAYNLPF